jgi:hypothetical protein
MVRWIELAGAKRQGCADGALGIPYESGDRLGDGGPVTWDAKQTTFYLAELEALAGRRQARALARAQARARRLTPRLLAAAEAVLRTDRALTGDPVTPPAASAGQLLSREEAGRARAESRRAAEAERARARLDAERETFTRLLGRLTTITTRAHTKALQTVAFANQTGNRYCTAVTRAYGRRTDSRHDHAWRPWSPPQIKLAAPWKDTDEVASYTGLLTKEAAELVRRAEECLYR